MPLTNAMVRRAHGRRIAAARKAIGLTQRQLADTLTDNGYPTTDRAVSQWETGVTAPAPLRRVVIALILRTTTAALFDLDSLDGDGDEAA